MTQSQPSRSNTGQEFIGAWMTDIDDTIIPSGLSPTPEWIDWLAGGIERLRHHRILWVPMSGVALVKLGPRILYHLPKRVLSGVLYYGGDGSQKYYFDPEKDRWSEDSGFSRLFTEAQALAVLGRDEFLQSFSSEAYEQVLANLKARQAFPREGVIGEMKQLLLKEGYDPGRSETYFRGGSVSWMMLGDISAEPYREEKALATRTMLIRYAEERLRELDYLKNLGETGIHVPFPGARGIKFVLRGNDKERGTRDLIMNEYIPPRNILFSGNELFQGGNDNMIRNIHGVTLLSVGEKTDPGEFVVTDGTGVEAYRRWMDRICTDLDKGVSWPDLIESFRK